MYIPIAVVTALILILFVPVRLCAQWCENNLELYVKIGVFKKSLRVKDETIEKGLDIQAEKREKQEKKEPGFVRRIMFYRELTESIKEDVFKALGYAARHGIKIELLNFRLNFGGEDAAAVGMLYGLVNAAVYTVLGVMHNVLFIKKWTVDIIPDYKHEIFDLKVDCILRTRLVHIIVIGIKFIKILTFIKKEKNKNT